MKNHFQSLWLLLARLWIAKIFFLAGLTKIRDWETTLLLFSEEYRVPILPPVLAAFMGTAGELVLPVLLVLGLGTHFASLGLFIVNVVAVISYPGLTGVALELHAYWAMLIMALLIMGAGRYSLDSWIVPILRARWHARKKLIRMS
jgi:putative oxidoreductase